uniref:Uncharacterized protein n=1 Tax=Chenopodium quinoa TaxID=63459 RepID=A0A803ME39_CHEQI
MSPQSEEELSYMSRECLVTGYSDSDYAADVDTRRSVTGYVFTLGGSVPTIDGRDSSVGDSHCCRNHFPHQRNNPPSPPTTTTPDSPSKPLPYIDEKERSPPPPPSPYLSKPHWPPTILFDGLRINTRTSSAASGGPNSPLVWAKNNQLRPEIAEPTSPKVTCAGQIKVRPSSSSGCKNWQSVMEEIERIHNRGKTKKKSKWVEGFGFKKDVMSFLTCLRNIRFDFRCFGAFPQSDVISSDDEEEDQAFKDEEFDIGEDDKENNIVTNNSNKAVFSKWFMVLQEENEGKDVTKNSKKSVLQEKNIESDDECVPAVPPPNALLLMR